MAESTPWDAQVKALGEWLAAQRKLANLSLRQLAEMTEVSSTYLSQIERGLHEPSMRVIKSISEALGLSVEAVLDRMGFGDSEGTTEVTEAAIRNDPILSAAQKEALLAVYRSYVEERQSE